MTPAQVAHIKQHHAFIFKSRRLAESFAFEAGRRLAVVLGDDGRHWVVTCADAQRLAAGGYSVAYLPGR